MKFTKILSVLLIVALFGALGCATEVEQEIGEEESAVVVDDTGREIDAFTASERLISLTPANTEILFALGLEERIVGVTSYCDYPEEAHAKEQVGGFADASLEKILALEPDVVFVTTGVQGPITEEIERAGIKTFAVDPKTVDELLDVTLRIGQLLDAEAEAQAMVQDLQSRVEGVRAAAAERPPKTVFYELYNEPLMTVGAASFIHDAIEIAGGKNIAGQLTEEYPQYSLEKLIEENPDAYIGSTGSMQSPGDIAARSGWDGLSAVRDDRVLVLDEDIITRQGPRLIDAIEQIAAFLDGEEE